MKLNKLPLNVIGLNRVGLNQIGSPSHRANTSDRPYIDPEVLASLVAVCICDGKSNNDPDRAVIKNLVDPDNPFVISNAAYKLNSGYGKYEEDFTDTTRWEVVSGVNKKPYELQVTTAWNPKIDWIALIKGSGDLKSVSLNVSGIPNEGTLFFYYGTDSIQLYNGNNKVTLSGAIPQTTSGYRIIKGRDLDWSNLVITQIPSFEGALVTDGKDDLITSTKTVKEMLGGSNEVTVVSMIHQIGFISSRNYARNNYFIQGNDFLTNTISAIGKIGIYGYKGNLSNIAIVNDILGDKKDYSVDKANPANIDSVFSVNGTHSSAQLSQLAWYWTIIANKVLTTDQINQVISYFNLDKHVKPDVYYDTIRQGITNENHASFNDELTDFSGNGHNMKIYNSAWNKESGINDEGAWQTDGVSDYGNVENLPILKDYTVAIERRWITSPVDKNQCLAFKGHTNDWGAFACEFSNAGQLRSYTFSPTYNILQSYNEKSLVYQSKYSYSGTPIDAKSTIDGSTLRLCLPRGGFSFYANVAIKMFLLFPYSLSEFLLERQLKRYKLGTLYPNMVEFRPIINVNIGKAYNVFKIRRTDTNELLYYYINGSVPNNMIGTYLPKGTNIRILVKWDNNRADVTQIKFNGKEYELNRNSDNSYYINVTLDKSPQKIDIYADEYIRYEDIVQPYPAIINLKQDGKTITWGDKLKVGSDIVFVGSANLLPELYTVSETRYNGVTLYPNTIIKVEKSMVFDNARTYLKANEPNCILSPNRLRIPNSSYKILRYIPDLTGKGNHGRLNNFAYTEESGANEDGSIRFDGTDDHIIIPTIKHGGKALLMKVNWRYKNNIAMAYDQRINWGGLGISISRDQLPLVAYKPYNKVTYIDGIKNESVLVQDLEGITHNITGIYDNLDLSDERDVCISRTSDASNSGFADMSMYEFMLFPDVPNEEEIKELNDIVGIEGNVWGTLTQLINSTLISNETLIKNE